MHASSSAVERHVNTVLAPWHGTDSRSGAAEQPPRHAPYEAQARCWIGQGKVSAVSERVARLEQGEFGGNEGVGRRQAQLGRRRGRLPARQPCARQRLAAVQRPIPGLPLQRDALPHGPWSQNARASYEHAHAAAWASLWRISQLRALIVPRIAPEAGARGPRSASACCTVTSAH